MAYHMDCLFNRSRSNKLVEDYRYHIITLLTIFSGRFHGIEMIIVIGFLEFNKCVMALQWYFSNNIRISCLVSVLFHDAEMPLEHPRGVTHPK